MNRMAFIAVALCAVLLATVGTGVIAAKQDLPPSYRVVQYDVTDGGKVVGKLSINTNAGTYVLNAHGLQPGTPYYLYYQGMFPYISTATANAGGVLHMYGAWDPQIAGLAANPPTYILSPKPLAGALTSITGYVYSYSVTAGSGVVIGNIAGSIMIDSQTGDYRATVNQPIPLTTPGDNTVQLAFAIPETPEVLPIGHPAPLSGNNPFTMIGAFDATTLQTIVSQLSYGGVFVYYTAYTGS